ncbi:hypothetical protein PHLCEN_2v8438 [Hermanssonia centrifuga]|uniref:Uncharacterized protein n=1 Tax=Hermanssonia centrifuga TaxID=98765 RepID=A0A2R6NTM3_9APHY|nr:hypothetical protein PHLCEN_2v8438 [Hermanssonia centrifuga]
MDQIVMGVLDMTRRFASRRLLLNPTILSPLGKRFDFGEENWAPDYFSFCGEIEMGTP